MQQALKPASGAAGAQVVAAELFGELDVATDDAVPALDLGFRGEGLPPLTRDAESWGGLGDREPCACQPPLWDHGPEKAGAGFPESSCWIKSNAAVVAAPLRSMDDDGWAPETA